MIRHFSTFILGYNGYTEEILFIHLSKFKHLSAMLFIYLQKIVDISKQKFHSLF